MSSKPEGGQMAFRRTVGRLVGIEYLTFEIADPNSIKHKMRSREMAVFVRNLKTLLNYYESL
jgi:hypothetical protein